MGRLDNDEDKNNEPGEDMTSFNNQNIRVGVVVNADTNAVVVVIAVQRALLGI